MRGHAPASRIVRNATIRCKQQGRIGEATRCAVASILIHSQPQHQVDVADDLLVRLRRMENHRHKCDHRAGFRLAFD